MLNFRNTRLLFLYLVLILIIAGFISNLVFKLFLIPVFSLLYFLIYGTLRIQSDYFFHSHCSAKTREKVISITFDDGPTEFTPQLLDILNNSGIKAAFFCIGKNIQGKEGILKRMDEGGHLVCNHSYSHSNWFDFYSSKKIIIELEKTEQLIFKAINKKSRLFRPPYGVTNPNIKIAIEKTGYLSVGWSVRSLDTVLSKEKVIKKIKKELKPGSVFLFHDKSEKIIPVIIEFLKFVEENNY